MHWTFFSQPDLGQGVCYQAHVGPGAKLSALSQFNFTPSELATVATVNIKDLDQLYGMSNKGLAL